MFSKQIYPKIKILKKKNDESTLIFPSRSRSNFFFFFTLLGFTGFFYFFFLNFGSLIANLTSPDQKNNKRALSHRQSACDEASVYI